MHKMVDLMRTQVDAALRGDCNASKEEVKQKILHLLRNEPAILQQSGSVEGIGVLQEQLESLKIVHISELAHTTYSVNMYTWKEQSQEKSTDIDDCDQETLLFTKTELPCKRLEDIWESLYLSGGIKERTLGYVNLLLKLSQSKICTDKFSYSRLILFYGPPGCGKTSLCKGLAQRIAISTGNVYESTCLIEVNAHSLFSKYFSESGKTVQRLFQQLYESASACLGVMHAILLDEVESLASNRESSLQRGEPTDSIRAVNALLTQLDRLRELPNVIILATSNLQSTIDEAIVDRADFQIQVGPPNSVAIYQVLRESLEALIQGGIISNPDCSVLLQAKHLSIPDLLRDNQASTALFEICGKLKKSEASGRLAKKFALVTLPLVPVGTPATLQVVLKTMDLRAEETFIKSSSRGC